MPFSSNPPIVAIVDDHNVSHGTVTRTVTGGDHTAIWRQTLPGDHTLCGQPTDTMRLTQHSPRQWCTACQHAYTTT